MKTKITTRISSGMETESQLPLALSSKKMNHSGMIIQRLSPTSDRISPGSNRDRSSAL
jgi:hypothetical protein